MAQPHLAFPNLAIEKFSGSDPEQDAEAFIRLIECKISFALGIGPEAGYLEHVIYRFRNEALFSSLLRGTAAEWYGSTLKDVMTWNEARTLFVPRFSDRSNKFRHRVEIAHCIRTDEEKIQKLLQPIRKTVDKIWPDAVVGVAVDERDAERTAKARQRRQRYIDYKLQGL